jgi:hypothetical protein
MLGNTLLPFRDVMACEVRSIRCLPQLGVRAPDHIPTVTAGALNQTANSNYFRLELRVSRL